MIVKVDPITIMEEEIAGLEKTLPGLEAEYKKRAAIDRRAAIASMDTWSQIGETKDRISKLKAAIEILKGQVHSDF